MITPNSFKNDPYGYVTNQGAHGGVVGLGIAIMLSVIGVHMVAAWIVGVALYWTAIEFGLQEESRPGGKSFMDGVEDTAHVGFGIAIHYGITASPSIAVSIFAGWVVVLGFGYWLRT